ncbi:uncharacterized protein L203_101423 [Cryptococcus depauperatus CBS 7841]|uniref:Uncharacterized protein n=1 Tax=Cryptococcus depauperatus CBS 7841 TaxID=1295531 RepID=A0A1E3ITS1_9TREE|nr:hypothetical protein L203_01217 [Cryptococcus depauperatus CBS 7841]
MPNPPISDFEQWRSPQSHQTPLEESTALPGFVSPKTNSPALNHSKVELLQPSFIPPCEHGDGSDMHAHAFDLLSLSGGTSARSQPLLSHAKSTPQHVPSSVPAHSSFLSSTRPPVVEKGNKESAIKARRMSSSTTGVLGRGKLGLTGAGPVEGLGLGGVGKEGKTISNTGPTSLTRRSTLCTSPAPQLFDFTKTDRRPSHSRPNPSAPLNRSASATPASLPKQIQQRLSLPEDDLELDMGFDEDDDNGDEVPEKGRSGSADVEMDEDDEYPMDGDMAMRPEWEKLALGTGSGGIKGRRKGMVFKCETCSKEYKHPSCLVKHRWEHSPHWKEPNALSMSKHQQVQMLEAAAILAHLDPTSAQGRSLPLDKSLWPAILSPAALEPLHKRTAPRVAREVSLGRSPSVSTVAPLTPSSLKENNAFNSSAERKNERKPSPESDSTTSSMGASEPYITRSNPPPFPRTFTNGPVIRSPPSSSSPYARHARPLHIAESKGTPSLSSSIPGPATPHSVGSLPDMANLKFSSSFTVPAGAAISPVPGRGVPLYMKTGMVGGGMFGVQTRVRDSSMRSGAVEEEEDGWGVKEEKDENGDWMAEEMEL